MNYLEAMEYIKKQNAMTEFEKIVFSYYQKLETKGYSENELKKEINKIYSEVNDTIYNLEEFEEAYLSIIIDIIKFDELEIEPNNLIREYSKMVNIAKKIVDDLGTLPKPPAYHYEVLICIYGEKNAKLIIDSITKEIYGSAIKINRKSFFAQEFRKMSDNIKFF